MTPSRGTPIKFADEDPKLRVDDDELVSHSPQIDALRDDITLGRIEGDSAVAAALLEVALALHEVAWQMSRANSSGSPERRSSEIQP